MALTQFNWASYRRPRRDMSARKSHSRAFLNWRSFQSSRDCLALMDDLDIVTVRIEHPRRIIAGIVFEPGLRCFLALASGGHSGFVECIHFTMVFRHKS